MGTPVFYPAGSTVACRIAARTLKKSGIGIAAEPGPRITDLLLDVPSFSGPGILRTGESPEALLSRLPEGVRVWGGRLKAFPGGAKQMDLLEDSRYLAENAAITADCAIRLSGPSLEGTWADTEVLVIGWGRIGKCLGRTLKALGAPVTVCARKPGDRALLQALRYRAIGPAQLKECTFPVIFNTVPAPMMEGQELQHCRLAMDLASSPGLLGPEVKTARGLPGIYAPESSGKLIADTVLRMLLEVN